jgi:hypothetical protein
MFARILLILTFGLQPTWLLAGVQGDSTPTECGSIACHEVVVTKSCCGEEIVVKDACDMTGGDCLCEVSFAPLERPEPAPIERTTSQVALALAPRTSGVTMVWPLVTCSLSALHNLDRAAPSHNTIQALLGVWQT